MENHVPCFAGQGILNKYLATDTFVEYLITNDSNQYYVAEENKLIQYRNKRNNKKRDCVC